jgi:hypothetical protein
MTHEKEEEKEQTKNILYIFRDSYMSFHNAASS